MFLDKIQDYQRNWLQHINRISRNGLSRIVKEQQKNGLKKPKETTEEIFERARMERVNKWSSYMLARC